MRTDWHQPGVGVAVVVGEAGRPEEDRRRLLPARDDDAKIPLLALEFLLVLARQDHLHARQVLDSFAGLDGPAGRHGSLVRGNGEAVGGGDLEGTLRQVHVEVLPQVPAEVLSLLLRLQPADELGDSRDGHESGLGDLRVLVDDGAFAQDPRDLLFAHATTGHVLLSNLADLRPEVDLRGFYMLADVNGIKKRTTYVVDQCICDDIIIARQLSQRHLRLLRLGNGGRHDLGRVCNGKKKYSTERMMEGCEILLRMRDD